MNEVKFAFSEATISDRKKRIVYMMIGMPVVMFIFMYIFMVRGSGAVDLTFYLSLCIGISVFIVLELLVISRMMFKRMRQMELIIHDQGFVRTGGKSKEEVLFTDIESLFVRRDYKNKIMFIRCKSKRKQILLTGFENMEDLLGLLIIQVRQVSGKSYKWDWNSPVAFAGIFGATTLLFIGLISLGQDIHQYFNLVFSIGFGIYFIGFKPISNSVGKRFRIFEVVCGGLILLGSLGTLIGMIF